MAHQARPRRRVPFAGGGPSVTAHQSRLISRGSSGASHQARAIRRGCSTICRRSPACQALFIRDPCACNTQPNSRPEERVVATPAIRAAAVSAAMVAMPTVMAGIGSPVPNRAADRTACRRVVARSQPPRGSAPVAPPEVPPAAVQPILRVALDDLVQLAAVQPDAAAFRAVVDLDPLAVAHHQVHPAARAGHASLGHASWGMPSWGMPPGPPAAGIRCVVAHADAPSPARAGTSTDVLDDGPAPLVSRLTHPSPAICQDRHRRPSSTDQDDAPDRRPHPSGPGSRRYAVCVTQPRPPGPTAPSRRRDGGIAARPARPSPAA